MNLIISTSKNNVIGLNGQMLWNIRGDIERYKKITKGGILIMGHTTYKSLRQRRLKYHYNIVLTTDAEKKDLNFYEPFGTTNVLFVNSVDQALEVINEINAELFKDNKLPKEVFVIGGAKTFNQFIPHIKKIYHTIVNKNFYDNLPYTTYTLDLSKFKHTHCEKLDESNNNCKTEFNIYVKK